MHSRCTVGTGSNDYYLLTIYKPQGQYVTTRTVPMAYYQLLSIRIAYVDFKGGRDWDE